jgi:hypothetical protein
VGDHVSNLIPRVLNGLEPVAGFMSCAIPDLYLEHQKSLTSKQTPSEAVTRVSEKNDHYKCATFYSPSLYCYKCLSN